MADGRYDSGRSQTPGRDAFHDQQSKHRFHYGAPKPKTVHGLMLTYGPTSYTRSGRPSGCWLRVS